ncbi:hypothetical protein [Paucibacter soli]|uniref:hypothetical protein n=1 Tax=Paucibacter soli TaxID=3133433 RepID=UPI0030AE83A1
MNSNRAQKAPGTELTLVNRGIDPDFDVIDSTQVLEPGFYWTAHSDCGPAKAGDTLLLIDVTEFEGKPHSVTINRHPRDGEGEFELMIADFLDAFVPCHDADAIRTREQQEIMGQVAALQAELMATQADPQLMIAAVMPAVDAAIARDERARAAESKIQAEKAREASRDLAKTHRRAARRSETKGNPLVAPKIAMASDVGSLIDAGINDQGVQQLKEMATRQAIVAEAQSRWLEDKTRAITNTLARLAPYIKERAAVALARSSGAIKMAERIRSGIESLDLYTGRGVEVYDIRTGVEAPESEPLTLIQGKRYADEELAVWADVMADFDYRDKQQFFDALVNNDSLLEQVLPTQRCVVSMATTRHSRYYSDPYESMMANIENKLVFLLIRNGQNVSICYSSSPSHEASPRLFPTRNELERPFNGWDGSRISIRDVEFGKASKRFDDIALHYKRFLILLCGLDHRLGLLGRFYPAEEQMQFMTAGFQERHFRFIADEESGSLLGEDLMPLRGWMAMKNAMVQSGSRAFLLDSTEMRKCAPELERRHFLSPTKKQFEQPIGVQKEGTRFLVSLEASDKYADRKLQSVKCFLTKEDNSGHDSAWWLCIDGVSLAEVRRYRHSRVNRAMGVAYLRLFRRLEAYFEIEEALEAASRAYLLETATTHGGMSMQMAGPALGAAIRNWRAARRGTSLPALDDKSNLHEVLNLMTPEGHLPAAQDAMLASYLDSTGQKPLLLTRSGKSKLVLYVEATAEDQASYPNILTWGWVRRITLDVGKTKLKEASATLTWLTKVLPASEVELRRWEGLEAWLHAAEEPISLKKYGSIPGLLAGSVEWLGTLQGGMGSGIPDELFHQVKSSSHSQMLKDKGRNLVTTYLAIPVGFHSNDGRRIKVTYMIGQADKVLYAYGNEAQRADISSTFPVAYRHRVRGTEVLREPFRWRLVEKEATEFLAHNETVKHHLPGISSDPKWAERKIQVNSPRKSDFRHQRKKGDGKPRLTAHTAKLSLDRAFAQLMGTVPGSLKTSYFAARKERAEHLVRWWPERREGESQAEMQARLQAKADAILKTPYVHVYKVVLSPLVWPVGASRSRANTLFSRPANQKTSCP